MLSHLISRHYDPVVSGMPWLSDTHITFPLWNFDGKLIGYQRYNPLGDKKSHSISDAKYFTHVTKGYNAIWGVESLQLQAPFIVVCEGIFKACRFHSYGIPALAVLGKNSAHLREQFNLLSTTRSVIGVLDPDISGLELIDTVPYFYIPQNYIDELSTEEMNHEILTIKQLFNF